MSTVTRIPRLDDRYRVRTPSAEAGHNPRTWGETTPSASDWRQYVDAESLRIRNECGRAGWDGDDAAAISDTTITIAREIALALLGMLPMGVPPPDLIPEADGEIALSWVIDARHVLSASIGEHRHINFAARFGEGGEIHGWYPITRPAQEGLEHIASYLATLYPPIASRRAA